MVLLPRSSENPRPFTHTTPGILTSVRDGRRVVAVDLETWASICTEVYHCNPARAPLAMDSIGQKLGEELAVQEQQEHPLSEDPFFDVVAYLSEMGWGRFTYSKAELKDFAGGTVHQFKINLKGSAFIQLKLGGSPICHFSVGVVKGALGVIQHETLQAWEDGCSAKGGDSCEIAVARR